MFDAVRIQAVVQPLRVVAAGRTCWWIQRGRPPPPCANSLGGNVAFFWADVQR